MASFALEGAKWIINKAVGKLSDDMLEAFAASRGLGGNVEALKTELLFAQAVLHNAPERHINNPALVQLLQQLAKLAYAAEDMLDELDYFCIQDELDDTREAATADAEVGGIIRRTSLHVRHAAHSVGKQFLCSSRSPVNDDGDDDDNDDDDVDSKLELDRVDISNRMQSMAERLKPLCDRVSNVLNLELTRSSSTHGPLQQQSVKRDESSSMSIETKLFGRDEIKAKIIKMLTNDKYKDEHLSVISIVGMEVLERLLLSSMSMMTKK